MPELIPVPDTVARTAAAALQTRAERGGGGTARGVVIATALGTGFVTEHEVAELRAWHHAHPAEVQGNHSTLIGGLYGGAPARECWPGLPDPAPVTAAARTPLSERLARLSALVNTTDQKLRLRLHAAAETALADVLARAAGKVEMRARSKSTKTAAFAKAAISAGEKITPAVMAAVGVTEKDLFDRRFETLALTAAGWIAAAEHRKLVAAARALGLDPSDMEDRYDAEIERRATAAAGALAAGLGILARQTFSGNVTMPDKGELSGAVPFSLIRNTWAIGATGHTPPVFNESGPAQFPDLAGRVTKIGDSIVAELLAENVESVGETTTTKTWIHGDPQREFVPHADLNGVSWSGDDIPEEMLADPAEWPYVDVYEPGDHDYCTCEIVEDISPSLPGESMVPDTELRATARDAVLAQPGPVGDLVDA